MKILVTGGAGFIGSAFVRRRLAATSDEIGLAASSRAWAVASASSVSGEQTRQTSPMSSASSAETHSDDCSSHAAFWRPTSRAETARVLGVPPGTVKSRTARALAALAASDHVSDIVRSS